MFEWLELLSTLSDDDKKNLGLFCQEKRVKKWEVLFSEWDEASAMYILKTGRFDIIKTRNGVTTHIWEVKAEEILWEMALFWDDSRRMAGAVALEDSVLITILSFSIKEMTAKYPQLLEKIKDIINERNIENKSKK